MKRWRSMSCRIRIPEPKRVEDPRPRRPAALTVAALIALSAACGGRGGPATPVPLPAGADTGVVAIEGPTLIGFFPRPTRATAADSGAADRQRRFQDGLARVRDGFARAGVQVYQQYTDTLVIREPGKGLQIYVPPAEAPIGYYLAAPGRDPEILHGLRSETELQEAAWRYFHDRGGARRVSR